MKKRQKVSWGITGHIYFLNTVMEQRERESPGAGLALSVGKPNLWVQNALITVELQHSLVSRTKMWGRWCTDIVLSLTWLHVWPFCFLKSQARWNVQLFSAVSAWKKPNTLQFCSAHSESHSIKFRYLGTYVTGGWWRSYFHHCLFFSSEESHFVTEFNN